ncbi:MAG: c-type cytochrome [Pseudobdellovibrionaceae bacterium]
MKTLTHTFSAIIALGLLSPLAMAEDKDKGIGPYTEAKIEATVDKNMANKGLALFTNKCSACHKIDERYVGPALKGVTKRRTPEWIMNMMLNPGEMLEKNDTAKELLGEYLVPMTFQNVTKDDARFILEYFRSVENGTAIGTATAQNTKESKNQQKKTK